MTVDEYIKTVAAFAKAYVNFDTERTEERNAIIRDAASVVLGKQLSTCQTCHIEAVVQIYNLSKVETKYRMLNGAVLEVFSAAHLVMTAANVNDELAELHLGLKPHEIVYFSQYPKNEKGEFVGVTANRLRELKKKFSLSLEYPTEVKPTDEELEIWSQEESALEEQLEENEIQEETQEESALEEQPKKRGRKPKAE